MEKLKLFFVGLSNQVSFRRQNVFLLPVLY
jgi:hypothetical protein